MKNNICQCDCHIIEDKGDGVIDGGYVWCGKCFSNHKRINKNMNEINFESTIKMLGEINERIYGVNPYEKIDPEYGDYKNERANEITQDNL